MHLKLYSAMAVPALGVVAVLSFSCSSGPSEPWRSLETREKAPKPTARLASQAGENLEQVGTGYWVFQRKCLECHESRIPKDPKHPDWHPVMQGMSWNAGLSSSEQSAVMAYLRAAAR